MFNIFKRNPIPKIEKLYEQKLEQAMNAQRNGNIELYAKLSVEAQELLKQLDALIEKSENE